MFSNVRLAYLCHFFDLLNIVDFKVQGKDSHVIAHFDCINGFIAIPIASTGLLPSRLHQLVYCHSDCINRFIPIRIASTGLLPSGEEE